MAAVGVSLLNELVGQPCWSAAAGLSREWLLVLDFGERLRRSLRLANPILSFEQRTFEGSHGLIVEGCWRLDGPDRVIVSCLDARAPTDRVRAGLEEVENRRVEWVRADAPAHDLAVGFHGGLVLRAFVLEPLPAPAVPVPEGDRPPAPPPPPRPAWSAWCPAGMLIVGPHGQLGDPRVPHPEPPPAHGRRLALVDEDDP